MKKKVIKLTEADLERMVKKVIKEDSHMGRPQVAKTSPRVDFDLLEKLEEIYNQYGDSRLMYLKTLDAHMKDIGGQRPLVGGV